MRDRFSTTASSCKAVFSKTFSHQDEVYSEGENSRIHGLSSKQYQFLVISRSGWGFLVQESLATNDSEVNGYVIAVLLA